MFFINIKLELVLISTQPVCIPLIVLFNWQYFRHYCAGHGSDIIDILSRVVATRAWRAWHDTRYKVSLTSLYICNHILGICTLNVSSIVIGLLHISSSYAHVVQLFCLLIGCCVFNNFQRIMNIMLYQWQWRQRLKYRTNQLLAMAN